MSIRWTKIARKQLYSAFEYISDDDPVAALSQVRKVKNMVMFLEDFPLLGRKENSSSVRKLLVPKTKYTIGYRVYKNHISIVEIIHQSMK